MKRIGTLTLTLALAALPLSAGVVYEIEVKDDQSGRAETTTMSAEGKNIKMTIAAGASRGGKSEAIFRGNRREMVVVDHAEQSYLVIDEETMQEIAGMISGISEQMAKALEGVPAEQRAMVEEMMKKRMPQSAPAAPKGPIFDVRRTGDSGEKVGYPCVKYDIFRGDRKVREMWVTDWENVDGSDEVAEVFEEMADFMNELLSALPMEQAPDALADSIAAQMKELDGFPVVTREFGADGSLDSESTLRSATRRTLDPSEFEPPAGYKRRQMMPGS